MMACVLVGISSDADKIEQKLALLENNILSLMLFPHFIKSSFGDESCDDSVMREGANISLDGKAFDEMPR